DDLCAELLERKPIDRPTGVQLLRRLGVAATERTEPIAFSQVPSEGNASQPESTQPFSASEAGDSVEQNAFPNQEVHSKPEATHEALENPNDVVPREVTVSSAATHVRAPMRGLRDVASGAAVASRSISAGISRVSGSGETGSGSGTGRSSRPASNEHIVFDKIVPAVYDELHRLAARHLRRE